MKTLRMPIFGVYPYLLILSLLTAFTFSIKRTRETFLIHTHDVLFGGFVGVLIKFMLRRTLIVTTHGLQSVVETYGYITRHGNTLLSQLNRIFLFSLEKFVITYADSIMCTSEYEYNHFLRRGVNPAKIKVVENGIDSTKFKSKRPVFSRNYITMLYAGRISPEKGVGALIRVFSLLERNYKNPYMLIVGEGTEKATIEKMIDKIKMNGKITILPPVGRNNMTSLYNDSDIVVFPSIIETGTPLTLLEAMACGRVVIVNSSGSLPLIVNNAGLIVPFNNPPRAVELIKRILNDKKEAVRLANLARQRVVKNFNWQNCFEEILNTYISLGTRGLDMSKLKS